MDLERLGYNAKEINLIYGSFIFGGIFVVSAIILGQHAHKESADRGLANHNRV
jgi:hypothetical protein